MSSSRRSLVGELVVFPLDLWQALTFALVSIFVAAPVGLIAGAIPGVGGKVALAIFAPIAVTYHPVGALMIMLSLHAVIRIGGALPAILLGVPACSRTEVFASSPMRSGFISTTPERPLMP